MLRPTLMLTVLVALTACSPRPTNTTLDDDITCNSGQVPIYTNRFAPTPGASGVATAPDAVNGATNSAPDEPVPSPTSSSVTAMTVSCGTASCNPGQVAVAIPPAPTGGGTEGPTAGPVSSGAIGTDDPSPGLPSVPAGSVDAGAPMIVCTSPPPACPTGQSPQFTMKDTWECTDCSIVVTYGGEFGNYRRCVGMPTISCHTGNVPTWSFTAEDWQCQPTCNNGEYDQHTIGGVLVCVPC